MLKRCIRGPYAIEKIYLSSDSTAVFRVGNFYGRYVDDTENYVIWQDMHTYSVGDTVIATDSAVLEASCEHPELSGCLEGCSYKIKEIHDEYFNIGTEILVHKSYFTKEVT